MKTKKFLIQLTFPADTRWPLSDAELAQLMQREIIRRIDLWTLGPVPAVDVSPDEVPEIVPHGENCVCQMCRK